MRDIVECLLLIVLSGLSAAAQNAYFSCKEPPEIQKLGLKEVQARLSAGAEDFFLYKRVEDLTPDRPKPGTLAPIFDQKLKQHPDEPRYLYLYGRSLIGKDTPTAIAQLNRVVELTPDFPWTYLQLARIYASRNFADPLKVQAYIHAYRQLCPGNLDGFAFLGDDSDPTETARWAKELRRLLERSQEQQGGRYWSSLWAAEFRSAPKSEYEMLRKGVATDVRRLESMPEPWRRDFLIDLATGYRLIERSDAVAKIEQRLDPDAEVHKAEHAFMEETNWTRQLSPEQREAAFRELAGRAAQWVEQWPHSKVAWGQLLLSLPHKPNWTKTEMEHAGEELLKADMAQDLGWSFMPATLTVAQLWVRYGIRSKDCVAMAEAALDEISLGPEVRTDLFAPPNEAEIEARQMFGFNHSLFNAMGVIVDGSLQLKDFDKVRATIDQMQHWIDANQSLKDDLSTGYWRFRGVWLNSAGKLAEAESHKLDAVALYTKAIAGGAQDPDMAKHARALWDELGGTNQGWSVLIASSPTAPKTAAPATPPVQVANEFAPWEMLDKGLEQINLHDLAGKLWTLSDLRGKTTFVTIWATWCLPCREELPSLQNLYEIVRNQKDIQVITLNIDDDPGLVQPFLAANHFTFPVLLSAAEYASRETGPLSIPQNWIVGGGGRLREKSVGFETKIADWPKEMLDKLEKALR